MKKVYIDELETKGIELVNYSQNDISEKIDELKSIKEEFKWNGIGYLAYINQYDAVLNKIERINNNLSLIAKFLLDVKDGYEEVNMDINGVYEKALEDYEELYDGMQQR